MTPTTAAVTAASAPATKRLPRSRSTKGAPAKMKRKEGAKVTQSVTVAAQRSGNKRIEAGRAARAGEEADEDEHQDERPGCRLGKSKAGQHLVRPKPVVILHRLLRHIGKHRIGAAECDDGDLGEEQRDLCEDVTRAQ